MNFEEMINNPSFVGVIGVIIGAIISGIINYINSKQNYKFQKEQNRIEKVEQTAIDFLLLMQKLFTRNLKMRFHSGENAAIQKLNEEILSLNERVKAEMKFYFEKNEYDIAMEICEMVDPKSKEEATKYNKLRTEKIDYLIRSINDRLKK